jgi:hypothetical protein
MARTTLRRLVTLPVAVLVAGGALASAPDAQAAPWLDTADVVAVIDTVTKLPDSYQVERMANNVPAVTVGQDTRAGLTRVTEFTDGGVTSDVITADGRGTWTAVEKTPEVNSELDYLGRAGGVRWTFAPDESTTTPAVVDEFAPARVLSTLPADLDYIMVTSYPLMGGASSE